MTAILKNSFLFIVSIAVSLALLESIARLFFSVDDRHVERDIAFIDYKFVPNVGSLLQPHTIATESKSCLKVEGLQYNSHGMRKGLSDPDRRPNIAITGDSYMEARQIPAKDTIANLLGNVLDAGVRNASIYGASTVKQHLLYKKFQHPHAPEIALHFAYPSNDIPDSNCAILDFRGKLIGRKSTEACGTVRDGKVTYRDPIAADVKKQGFVQQPRALKSLIQSECRICQLVWNALKQAGILQYQKYYDDYIASRFLVNIPVDELPPESGRQIKDALIIVEDTIRRYQRDVIDQGGTLVVVMLPSHHEYSLDWRAEFKNLFGIDAPEAYDPHLSSELMTKILTDTDTRTISLIELFDDYIATHNLPFPWLSFRCDGHLNPLGHFLTASFVAQRLVEMELIDVDDPAGFVAEREAERKQGPKEIIGALTYDQIYEGGFYQPAK